MTYQTRKNQTYKKYKRIKAVFCPYLKTEVVFNAKGFWHLIYSARNKKRNIKNQTLRFQLLDQAKEIIRLTHTLQEYQRLKKAKKKIRYYGFIAIMAGWKIKVIVKKIGNGRPFFWSVIPNWKTRGKEKLFFRGSLDID